MTVCVKGHSALLIIPVRGGKKESKSTQTVFEVEFLRALRIPQTLFGLIVFVVKAQMRVAVTRGQVARFRRQLPVRLRRRSLRASFCLAFPSFQADVNRVSTYVRGTIGKMSSTNKPGIKKRYVQEQRCQ